MCYVARPPKNRRIVFCCTMESMFADPQALNLALFSLQMGTVGSVKAIAREQPDDFELLLIPKEEGVEFLAFRYASRQPPILVGSVFASGVKDAMVEYRRNLGLSDHRDSASHRIIDSDGLHVLNLTVKDLGGKILITGSRRQGPEKFVEPKWWRLYGL